jgi:hypothetical protein
MRHLCAHCSSLKVGREGPYNRLVVENATDTLLNVLYLTDSSEGIITGKACHFCAIILRSLKDHRHLGTKEETTSLPKGNIKLLLTGRDEEEYAIVAEYFEWRGVPIRLSLGSGESSSLSYRLPSHSRDCRIILVFMLILL